MLNSAIIQGRLTADPELKRTSSDTAVASFSVAVDRDFVKQGEDRQADFINVVAWRQSAEFVTKYFHKGSQIIVQGRLQTRKWDDADGKKRYATEIIADHINFCESKRQDTANKIDELERNIAGVPSSDPDFVEIQGENDLPF